MCFCFSGILTLNYFCQWNTVAVIWNWGNGCILGIFVTQKFVSMNCETYLSLLCICLKASLTNRLRGIENWSIQFWEIVIFRKHTFKHFCLTFKKFINLAFLKSQFLRIVSMNSRFLKLVDQGGFGAHCYLR